MNYKIYVDGFSSPKKKNLAGYAVYVENERGEFIKQEIVYINPTDSNNVAELEALKHGLKTAHEVRKLQMAMEHAAYPKVFSKVKGEPFKAIIYSDSLLSVNLYKGKYRTKKPKLAALTSECQWLGESLNVEVSHVPRGDNKAGKVVEKYVRKK